VFQHLCSNIFVSTSVFQLCFSTVFQLCYNTVFQHLFQLCFSTVFQHLCSSICVPASVFQHLCSSTCVPASVFQPLCSSSVTTLCFSICSSTEFRQLFQHRVSTSVPALCFSVSYNPVFQLDTTLFQHMLLLSCTFEILSSKFQTFAISDRSSPDVSFSPNSKGLVHDLAIGRVQEGDVGSWDLHIIHDSIY
jgi:hypothetical protein